MIRTINGKQYVMRDKRPMVELRKLYTAFVAKYLSTMTFEQWMVDRGKVTQAIR